VGEWKLFDDKVDSLSYNITRIIFNSHFSR